MTQRYTFGFYQKDDEHDDYSSEFPIEKQIDHHVSFSDNTTWCVVLESFLDFLGNVYGYDVRQSVQFKSLAEKLAEVKNKYGIEDDDEYYEEEDDCYQEIKEPK